MGEAAGAITGAVTAIAGVTTGAIAANKAKKEANRQDGIAETQQAALSALEADRPVMSNPYENMRNEFEDLSNPYANLTVATEAFKMQSEAADQALANSLDVMMETGQGAGGATALAQAALQSKRGIAASINAQEVQNKAMAAEGEASVQTQIAQGAQRLDEMRAQGDTLAQQDAINFHEAKMDRTAKLLDNELQNEQDQKASRTQAIMGIGNSIMGGVNSAVSGLGENDAKIGKP